MSEKWIKEGIIVLLVLLFAYAGSSVVLDYQLFRNHLMRSPWQLLSHTAAYTVWILACLELLIAVLLILPKTRIKGLWIALIVLLTFTTYIVVFLLSDKELPCSCGSVFNFMNWQWHLVFNIVFILLTEAGLLLHIQRPLQLSSIFKYKKQHLK